MGSQSFNCITMFGNVQCTVLLLCLVALMLSKTQAKPSPKTYLIETADDRPHRRRGYDSRERRGYESRERKGYESGEYDYMSDICNDYTDGLEPIFVDPGPAVRQDSTCGGSIQTTPDPDALKFQTRL